MYEKHLKRVHLSRLSPVTWSWRQGYPRKEVGVFIGPAYDGMGACHMATPINPKGSPAWSETWQQRAAGALHRVNIQSMDGCCPGVGTANGEGQGRPMLGFGLLLAFGAGLLYWYTR